MAKLRRYISLANGSNVFAKAGAHYHNQADALIELLEGAKINSSAAGAEVTITTDVAHGLSTGELVRVFGHRASVPQVPDLIDPTTKYVVTDTPTATTLKLNVATTGAGFGGYVGRVMSDFIRNTNVEMVLVSDFEDAPNPPQDRVG